MHNSKQHQQPGTMHGKEFAQKHRIYYVNKFLIVNIVFTELFYFNCSTQESAPDISDILREKQYFWANM